MTARHLPRAACLLFLAATRPLASAAEPAPHLPAERAAAYRLAWHDEFEGDKLDDSHWTCRTGDRFGSRNRKENVSVSGGALRIALKKEKAGDLDYTSGGVISKREFLHGYYEARFRVPPGKGWHTSFWMMKNTPGEKGNRQEIDVCEQDSYKLTEYGINFHVWKPEHLVVGGTRPKTPDLAADFHVYGCEFTPEEVRYYFDGRLVHTQDARKFTPDVQSIWLTTVGWTRLPWSKDAKIDDTRLPAEAAFDYVRFFEPVASAAAPATARKTVVVFGDSLTEGGALPKDQRDQAWVRLVERDSHGALAMINEGKGGRPTASLKEFEGMLQRRPQADTLVIALGTNDSRDITPACVPKAVANVGAMIARARAAYGAKLRIVLVGPPNLNKSALVATQPIANEREAKLRELGAAFAKLAREERAEFVDLFGVVPESSMTKDGVHPDPAGNAAIARIMIEPLLRP